MPTSLPLQLLFGWVMFLACVTAQAAYERRILANHVEESARMLKAIQISNGLALLVGFAVLVFYFLKVAWFWPLVLVIGGAMAGNVVRHLFSWGMGERRFCKHAFAWPIFALWAAIQISELL
jgi:hypothetical protein